MKIRLSLLFTLFFSGIAMSQDGLVTPLKASFAEARAESNMAIALSQLWKADLYVVVGSPGDESRDFYITPSPTEGRWAVTVSEKQEWLKRISSPKAPIKGSELITRLNEKWEIVIVYGDGGDYVRQEHLSWLREALSGATQ